MLAASPFAVAIVTLVVLRWSGLRAGLATLAVAMVTAGTAPSDLVASLVGGSGTAARVLYVLFGGLLLFRILSASGAIDSVSEFLSSVEPRPPALALGVVVGVSPFFESVTGFGVAIVISAPILLAAGFSPLRAAVLAAWGQCAVPWGALAVGTVLGADLAGLTFQELSDSSALANLLLYPLYGMCALALAGATAALRENGVEAIVLGLAAGVGTLATSILLTPELAGALGGLAAVAVFLARRRSALRAATVPARALSPYIVLLGLIAVSSLTGATEALPAALAPVLEGPGPWLLVAAAFAAVVLHLGRARESGALAGTRSSGHLSRSPRSRS